MTGQEAEEEEEEEIEAEVEEVETEVEEDSEVEIEVAQEVEASEMLSKSLSTVSEYVRETIVWCQSTFSLAHIALFDISLTLFACTY